MNQILKLFRSISADSGSSGLLIHAVCSSPTEAWLSLYSPERLFLNTFIEYCKNSIMTLFLKNSTISYKNVCRLSQHKLGKFIFCKKTDSSPCAFKMWLLKSNKEGISVSAKNVSQLQMSKPGSSSKSASWWTRTEPAGQFNVGVQWLLNQTQKLFILKKSYFIGS